MRKTLMLIVIIIGLLILGCAETGIGIVDHFVGPTFTSKNLNTKPSKTLDQYDDSYSVTKKSKQLVSEGILQIQLSNDYVSACYYFDKAIDESSNNVMAWYMSGICDYNEEYYIGARQRFDKACGLAPDVAKLHFLAGKSWLFSGYKTRLRDSPEEIKAFRHINEAVSLGSYEALEFGNKHWKY